MAAIGVAGWSVLGIPFLDRAAHLYLLVLAFHVLGRLVHQTRDRVDWEV